MANIEQLELFSEFGSQNLNLAKADSDVLPVMRERQIFSPCNQFSLDLCQYADYTSTWQMPKVAGETITLPPSEIQAFYRSKRTLGPGVWGHCYTEDRRLLPFLTNPYKMLERLDGFEVVIGLDLSIKPEMPLPMIVGISYYNKLVTCFWQKMGKRVVQNVVWACRNTYDICFDGYARHAVVAVNSTGIGKDKRSQQIWDDGYEAMIDALDPTLVIRYGSARPCEKKEISVYYENDNQRFGRYGR